jgi:hypothetical protein
MIEAPYKSRFAAALADFAQARGQPADRHWQALLYLATSDAGLWSWLRARMDEGIDVTEISGTEQLNDRQRLLLDVALNLFRGRGQVDLARIADVSSTHTFESVIEALRLYRGEWTTGDIAHVHALSGA